MANRGFYAVATVSSKGGVGKSMCAANLAVELHQRGIRVGILDADVDSPYMAEILGASGKVDLTKDRIMVPVDYNGIPVMSFALWVPEKFGGATMDGAMHERWITDAIEASDWGPIDLLIIDLPAGTSSNSYTAVRRVFGDKFLGLIAVALPNVVSGLRRVYQTAGNHNMRILGVIENMSGDVFGTGQVKAFCEEKKLRFLGTIPLDGRIRERHESHEPALPFDLRGPIMAAADECLRVAPQVVTK